MKTTKILTVATCVALLALTGCNNDANHNNENVTEHGVTIENENTNEETKVATDTSGTRISSDTDWEKQREEFRTSSEARIEQNDMRLTEMEKKSENSNAKLKKQYQERVSALKERNAKMREKLKSDNETNKDKWNEFKREFNHDMDELGKALEEFTKDNKK
jgi:hypothetical protein